MHLAQSIKALDQMVGTLPLPVRHPVQELIKALKTDDSVASAWFLKDAAEALIRVCFTVGAAELLRLDPATGSGWLTASELPPSPVRQIAYFIRCGGRPWMGDFYGRIRDLLVPNANLSNGPLLPAIANWWCSPQNPRAKLGQLVQWRNEFQGHGTLGDPKRAGEQTGRMIGHLIAALNAFAPVLPYLEFERHEESGSSFPGRVHARGNRDGSLSPLVEVIGTDAEYSFAFLEGFENGKGVIKYTPIPVGNLFRLPRVRYNRAELDALEKLAAPTTLRGRATKPGASGGLELGWLRHLEDIRFVGYGPGQSTRPKYLIDRINDVLRGGTGGAVRVVGPGGSGKSFFARALADEWRRPQAEPAVVLPYFAQPGQGVEGATFAHVMSGALHEETRRLESLGVYLRVPTRQMTPEPAAVREWFDELRSANPATLRLYLIVDGIDELRFAGERRSLVHCLDLRFSEGVYLIVLGRDDDELDPIVARSLRGLPWMVGSPVRIETAVENPASKPNYDLVFSHLAEHYNELKGARDAILRAADGRFLYATMLAIGLREGAFSVDRGLPRAGAIVTTYLNWLVGRTPFLPDYSDSLGRAITFLAAAAMRVPEECLVDWGIDVTFVEEILLDLRAVLARDRGVEPAMAWGGREPYVYGFFHREFLEDVRRDPLWGQRVKDAHAMLLTQMIGERDGLWMEGRLGEETVVSWDRPQDCYAMLSIAHHLASLAAASDANNRSVPVSQKNLLDVAMRLNEHSTILQMRRDLRGARACSESACGLLPFVDLEDDAAVSRFTSVFTSASRTSAELLWFDVSVAEAVKAVELSLIMVRRKRPNLNALENYCRCLRGMVVPLANSGQLENARRYALHAIKAARRLVSRGYRNGATELGHALRELGQVERGLGNRAGAREAYEEALDIARRIREQTTDSKFLRDLLVTLRLVGELVLENNDLTAAEAYFEEAVHLAIAILREDQIAEAYDDAAHVLERLANVQVRRGHHKMAVYQYELAFGLRRVLLNHSETPDSLLGMARVLTNLGVAQLNAGDSAKAHSNLQDARKCVERFITVYGEHASARHLMGFVEQKLSGLGQTALPGAREA